MKTNTDRHRLCFLATLHRKQKARGSRFRWRRSILVLRVTSLSWRRKVSVHCLEKQPRLQTESFQISSYLSIVLLRCLSARGKICYHGTSIFADVFLPDPILGT